MEAANLLESLHEAQQVGSMRFASQEHMEVIGHGAIGEEAKLMPSR
jgi:hypothetical protein